MVFTMPKPNQLENISFRLKFEGKNNWDRKKRKERRNAKSCMAYPHTVGAMSRLIKNLSIITRLTRDENFSIVINNIVNIKRSHETTKNSRPWSISLTQ